MSVTGSVISTTDLELFKNLSNPAKVDVRQNSKGVIGQPDIPPTTINGELNSREHTSKHDDKSSSSRSSTPERPSHSRPTSPPTSPPSSRPRSHSHSNSRSKSHSRSRSKSRSRSPSFSRRGRLRNRSSALQQPVRSHDPFSFLNRRSSSPSQSQTSYGSKEKHNNRDHPMNQLKPILRSGRHDDHNDLSPVNLNSNPFRSNHDSGQHISAFYNKTSHSKSQTPSRHSPPASIFEQATQKYLQTSPPLSPVKLPMHGRGPSMGLPTTTNPPPRFFSPNPLDRPNLLDNIISPDSRRRKDNRSNSRSNSKSKSRSTSRRHHTHHHRRQHRRQHRSRKHGSHSRSHSRKGDSDDEMTHQEKRRYLLELEKLKLQGVKLTREYSMSDSLADIRFEHDSHRSNYDVVDSVNFMKDILGVSFTVIEALNNRFGPILQLRGWSTYMKKNMSRFDRLLERAYHRFWRHGQPSPFMEFGWLVFGSMLMWHLQNKYLGGLPVGDMIGLMGSGSGGGGGGGGGSGGGSRGITGSTQNQPNNTGDSGNSASDGGGAGFSLGSILRMFTGNGNANRPPPPQSEQLSAQPQRPPSIIPPVPSQPVNRTNPNQNSTTNNSRVTGSVPVTAKPVPPSGMAATLPPMNVRGLESSNNSQNPVVAPQRRMLRRPSAHLREAQEKNNEDTNRVSRTPLSPVRESNQERNIPSPP